MKRIITVFILAMILVLTCGCNEEVADNTRPQVSQEATTQTVPESSMESTKTTPTSTPTSTATTSVPKGPAYVNVTKGGLNIRSAPDTSVDNFVEYLYNRDIVDIIEPNSPEGWHKVRSTGGEIGYCKAEYLTSILGTPIDQVKKDVVHFPCQEDDSENHIWREGTIKVTLNNTPYTLYWSTKRFFLCDCYSVSFANCFLLDSANRVVSWIPADPLPDEEEEEAEYEKERCVTLEEAFFHDVNEDGQQDIILTWAHQEGSGIGGIYPSPTAFWSMAYGVDMQFVYDPYTQKAPVYIFSDAFVSPFSKHFFDSNMKILKEHVKKNPPELW